MARIKNATFLQRQKIAVIGFAVIVAAGLVWLMSLVVTERVSGEFIEGEDYLVLEEPRRVRGDAIEIMEFFSYGCIHCYSLDPRLDDLIETHGDTIRFVRTPVVSNEYWRRLGAVYFALRETNQQANLHTPFFDAIHMTQLQFPDDDSVGTWVDDQGADGAAFVEAMKSSNVQRRLEGADRLARTARVASVPALLVNGKYLVRPTRDVSVQRMLQVADHLIERETNASEPANE
ncbi:MAG: thiol:disulfide interchange protein DsbA/DsbL [Pseudomonadales bacterium]|nr:thiol:disulfide interchange protein DsbA/DsbL [Pseudomonadales bacterium]